uniref:F-box/kelch-repeat protein At3g06240-like n=1 Tax=Erigeron canadensis TaxID=72917 RepID=UPI001CB89C96|nr:F-box/kelch-repeat protein At3g06240-like [Erigeron canadensis]
MVVPDDIVEQILVRLDWKYLIHCMRVCKSWHSLVSGFRFAVSRFTYRNRRRQRICIIEDHPREHLVGSSNGLVCIFTRYLDYIVVNPLTRELKKLENHPDNKVIRPSLVGFGYDSSSDDYKVISGRQDYVNKDMQFHMFSVKSNVWKFVGEIECSSIRMVSFNHENNTCGILCNGALHWFVLDQHKNPVILSFDLSTEEFKELPQPDDANYKKPIAFTYYRLGMVEESLCIFHDHHPRCASIGQPRASPKWVMKNYDSRWWELLSHQDQWDNDFTLRLKNLIYYNRVKKSFFHEGKQCILNTLDYISAPIYVESLVSPQVNERPKNPVSRHVSGGRKRKRNTKIGF